MELDPITADFPSRTAREEDEEAAERATGGGLAPEAVAMWTPAVLSAPEGRVKTPLMIVATTPESCALLRSALAAASSSSNVSLLGALVLPGLSLSGTTLFATTTSSSSSSSSASAPAPLPAPTDRVCAVLSIKGEGGREGEAAHSTVVVVLCQYYPFPEERAFGLAAALCSKIDAGETLVLSSLASHLIPGSAGAEEGEPPLYRVQTRQALGWARRAQEKISSSSDSSSSSSSSVVLSALPPGAAASGFPAALLSRAAATGRAALLLVRADARAGAPTASALAALASGAAAAVSVSSSSAGSSSLSVASALMKASAAGTAAAAAAVAAARADAASARAAVYA